MADSKLGTEFQVNTYTLDRQENPTIATDAAGNFVITWDSLKQDGSRVGTDVYAQRYAKDGTALGGEFRVNTTLERSQAEPDIAMAPSGSFVVVWEGEGNDPARGTGADSDRGIFAQRYDSAKNPIGTEFQINTTIANAQDNPKVAMDAQGNFVAVWGSDDIGINYNLYAQRFNAQGIAQGNEFLVAATKIAGETEVDVAMDTNGNFVVTWATQAEPQTNNSVLAQRFDRNGNLLGNAFLVGSFNASGSGKPVVDMDAVGNFVVSWYGGSGNVLARRYNSLGVAQSNELLVTFSGNNPDVALGDNGDFVTTWTATGGIKARRFNQANLPEGPEFQVSATATPFEPGAIAMDGAGHYTVAWQGSKMDNGDNDIYAQRFANTSIPNTSPSTPTPGAPNPGGKILKGTTRANRLRGSQSNDTLLGLGGNDKLIGNQGNDKLLGGAGNDMLTGGAGRDSLIGGRGADRFVLQVNAGFDLIQDFKNGQDRLVLSGSLQFRALEITQQGNTTFISLESNVLVQLTGVSANQINRANFALR